MKPGVEAKTIFYAASPKEQPVKQKNVIGVLRGSDPLLRNTYVMLTAHYDHIGMLAPGDGDRIYNGANDDASGVAAVLEIANTLTALKIRPKRSIAFVLFFGEEAGLLGSAYYAKNPVLPLSKTIAQINLEQIGRTDDSEGPQVAAASLTGFDYSDVGAALQSVGARSGVKISKHQKNSDDYFTRSDNAPLAKLGIPAHTLSVAYDFPDYHNLDDTWAKIDYINMARITRVVANTVVGLADSRLEPRWTETNPKTKPFIDAARERREAEISTRPAGPPKVSAPKSGNSPATPRPLPGPPKAQSRARWEPNRILALR
jgi:Zn-dependent M28 family amino/carboxypeptidase